VAKKDLKTIVAEEYLKGITGPSGDVASIPGMQAYVDKAGVINVGGSAEPEEMFVEYAPLGDMDFRAMAEASFAAADQRDRAIEAYERGDAGWFSFISPAKEGAAKSNWDSLGPKAADFASNKRIDDVIDREQLEGEARADVEKQRRGEGPYTPDVDGAGHNWKYPAASGMPEGTRRKFITIPGHKTFSLGVDMGGGTDFLKIKYIDAQTGEPAESLMHFVSPKNDAQALQFKKDLAEIVNYGESKEGIYASQDLDNILDMLEYHTTVPEK
jgi:hypothetical protein